MAKKKIIFETYILPEFWACSLINCDNSGLDNEEIKAIEKFINENQKPDHMFYCVQCSEEAFFKHSNDAFNLGCNCLEFTFNVSPLN